MEFAIKGNTVKSGWSIVNNEVSYFIILEEYFISFSEDWFCLNKQCWSLNQIKDLIMRHFIWVSTVWQSNCYGVSVHLNTNLL